MQHVNKKWGIALAFGSAICFATSNALTGLAYRGGSDPITLMAFRFILPALALYLILRLRGIEVALPPKQGIVAVILGFITAVYALALLSAFKSLPLPVAILIFFLFPILTLFFLAVLGWEKLTPTLIGGAFVAFVGLGLVLGVEFDSLDRTGMLLAVAAAVGLAIVSTVSSRMIHGQDPRQVTLYISASATVTMVIIINVFGAYTLPITLEGWVGFVLSNIVFAFALIGFFAAIAFIGAAKTGLLSNMEPVATVGTAFVLLDQTLSSWQLVGVVIVVSALVFVSRSKADDRMPEHISE